MIIPNKYKGKTDSEIVEIKQILNVVLPQKITGRKQGFGELWTAEKEEELQAYVDQISEKYNFDFRLNFCTTESLWDDDYRQFKKYL